MTTRTLTLAKDDETFVFRYSPGYDDEMVAQFVRLAQDSRNRFDWLDAALLSFQVTCAAALDSDEAFPCQFQNVQELFPNAPQPPIAGADD